MIAAAERIGAAEIWTEDLADGQTYCGVKAVNPFK
jgi:predicted nucleic acid-binding protein